MENDKENDVHKNLNDAEFIQFQISSHLFFLMHEI